MPKCIICESDDIHGEAEITVCEACLDLGFRLTEPMDLREVA